MKTDPKVIPTITSSDAVWIEWHKALKGYFGHKTANEIFVKAWAKRGGKTADANTKALRDYADKNGIVIDETALASLGDWGSNVFDFIGDFFMLGKYATIGVIVIAVAGLGMIVFNVAKKPIESVKALTSMRGGV